MVSAADVPTIVHPFRSATTVVASVTSGSVPDSTEPRPPVSSSEPVRVVRYQIFTVAVDPTPIVPRAHDTGPLEPGAGALHVPWLAWSAANVIEAGASFESC